VNSLLNSAVKSNYKNFRFKGWNAVVQASIKYEVLFPETALETALIAHEMITNLNGV
jgi:hypothetical protein